MDNARPHTSALTSNYFTSRQIEQLKQAPHSPDLNLCDRFLFYWLKSDFKRNGLKFKSADEVKKAALQVVRSWRLSSLRKEVDLLMDHCRLVIEAGGC